jgi:hypothetical protein
MPDNEVSSIECSQCNRVLPASILATPGMTVCPNCSASLEVYPFPAILKKAEIGKAGETIIVDGESSCFYHPEKKATIPCSHCGRFLCALCDVDFNGEHFCPQCLDASKTKGKLKNLENRRVLYDDIALSLCILPALFYPCLILSAPITLFVAIKYWKAPSSIIPRSKLRMVIAIVFASIQLIGSIFLYGFLVYSFMNSKFLR